jgi:hypothetical protein
MENSEKGSRTLPDLMDDLFDGSGVFRAANFEFRFDETTDKIQFRAGNFANSNAGWTDITTFFNITGTFNASTTYNNFDLITLTNKDVYIVHGLSSGTTFADEAAVIASANTDKLVDVSEARDWASKTDGQVVSTDYSSKAYAVGGTGIDTTTGSAKDWAIKTSSTVGNTGEYSAKYWATSTAVTTVSSGIANINTVAAAIASVNTTAANISNVNTVAGISADVTTVANIDGNVSTVAGISANTTTVAGIASNVTTVAGVATNVTTVSGIASNVTTVANNNTNVTTVATNVADVNTVAGEINNNNLQTVANDIAAVITLADDLNEATSEIDTVANSITNVDTVGNDIANVNSVATNIANVNTSATNIANVNTVAGISANVTTVAGISADVTTAATNNANITTVAGISSNVTTVAGISSNVTTVAGIAADVTTAATNVTAFNNTYLGAQSSAPTQDPDGSALDVGDLYFDTVADVLKVRASGGWINAGSAVNGTANRFTFTATSGQTTFTGADANGETLAYDSGYMDIYMNGVKLAAGDYTASNGTSVVIAPAAAGDTLEMIAYGTFNLANVAINDLTDVNTTGLANNDVLVYNSSNSRFEPSTKLGTIETNADVTDTANVTAAGALMDSELTDITAVKALDQGVATTDKPTFNGINSTEALPTVRPSLLLDFANSKTLDPRITFTRGSTGTYWDGKTTTKAEENLVTYSQELRDATWTNGGVVFTENDTTAPDGTTTADKVTFTNQTTSRFYQVVPNQTGGYLTFSFYAKYVDKQWISVRISESAAGTPGLYLRTWFDLSNGIIGTDQTNDATMTSVGNGWYRCTVTSQHQVSSDAFLIRGAAGDNATSNVAAAGDVYLWGFQAEQRSSATAYTATTSSPIVKYQPTLQTAASGEARFDHDPVTGESKGFLIEEARTNLGTYSSYISGSISEYISVRTTQSQNQIIAPDGTLTGDKLIATADSSTHRLDQVARSMFSVSTTYTVSCYAKAGEYEGITLSIIGSSNSNNGVYFNLTTGSSGVIGGSYTSTMEDVGNGWYRCSVTRTTPSSITSSDNKWLIGIVDSGSNISFTGDGFSGVYVWGVQVEQGAFPTSYIPTSGSTVTRSGELTSVSTSTVMSTHDGSIYVESTSGPAGWDTTGQYNLFQFGDSNADGLGVFKESGTKKFWYHARRANSSFTNVNGSLTWADNTTSKVVLGFNNSSQRFYVDGTLIGTEQTAALTQLDPTQVTELNIGTSGNAAYHQFNGYIKKVACWPKRLPNATLQAMTEA